MRRAQLGQAAGTTSAVSIYSPPVEVAASNLVLTITNVTGTADKYSVWQDDDGNGYTASTLAAFDVVIEANKTTRIQLGPMGNPDGNLAVACGTGASVTFTLHGNERKILPDYVDNFAAEFDGANGLFASSSPVTAYPITMGCWFKTSTADQQRSLISVRDSSVASRWMTLRQNFTGGLLAMEQMGGGITFAANNTNYADGNPHFAVAGFDSAILRAIDVDAATRVTQTSSMAIVGTMDETTVGHRDSDMNDSFDGVIDNAWIHNKAYSVAEVAWLYNSGAGRSFLEIRDSLDADNPGEPDAYWPLREVAGSTRLGFSGNIILAERNAVSVARVAPLITP